MPGTSRLAELSLWVRDFSIQSCLPQQQKKAEIPPCLPVSTEDICLFLTPLSHLTAILIRIPPLRSQQMVNYYSFMTLPLSSTSPAPLATSVTQVHHSGFPLPVACSDSGHCVIREFFSDFKEYFIIEK